MGLGLTGFLGWLASKPQQASLYLLGTGPSSTDSCARLFYILDETQVSMLV